MVHAGGAPRKYPWDLWQDGEIHWITQGVDFKPPPLAMITALHRHARRTGLRVLTKVRGNQVQFKYINKYWWEEEENGTAGEHTG